MKLEFYSTIQYARENLHIKGSPFTYLSQNFFCTINSIKKLLLYLSTTDPNSFVRAKVCCWCFVYVYFDSIDKHEGTNDVQNRRPWSMSGKDS